MYNLLIEPKDIQPGDSYSLRRNTKVNPEDIRKTITSCFDEKLTGKVVHGCLT